MKALVLNCTLKKSPDLSNTAMLAGEIVSGLEGRGVECERTCAHNLFHVAHALRENSIAAE